MNREEFLKKLNEAYDKVPENVSDQEFCVLLDEETEKVRREMIAEHIRVSNLVCAFADAIDHEFAEALKSFLVYNADKSSYLLMNLPGKILRMETYTEGDAKCAINSVFGNDVLDIYWPESIKAFEKRIDETVASLEDDDPVPFSALCDECVIDVCREELWKKQ